MWKRNYLDQNGLFAIKATMVAALILVIATGTYLAYKQYKLSTGATSLHTGITTRLNLHYGPDKLQTFDAAWHPNAKPTPAVILVHGGQWTTGDKSNMDAEGKTLATAGWAAFSINYRFGGYPTESNDVYSAVQYIRAHYAAYNINPSKIGMLGTSAGGNLSATAITNAQMQPQEPVGIAALVTWSGPMDLTKVNSVAPELTTLVQAYLGCAYSACPAKYNAASPILHVSAKIPPMMLVNSTNEIVPLAQAQSMATRLHSVGVDAQVYTIKGSLHGQKYATYAWIPTITFLEKYLGTLPATLPAISNTVSTND